MNGTDYTGEVLNSTKLLKSYYSFPDFPKVEDATMVKLVKLLVWCEKKGKWMDTVRIPKSILA